MSISRPTHLRAATSQKNHPQRLRDVNDLTKDVQSHAPKLAPIYMAAIPPDAKHAPKPRGLLLLDWDGTIIKTRHNNPLRNFINAPVTKLTFDNAVNHGIDIRIVTAMPATQEGYTFILNQLKQLNLISSKHPEEFWRNRIHCVLRDMAELHIFNTGKALEDPTPVHQRKKICIENILRQPQYAHLTHNDVQFYDDDADNCAAVKEIKKNGHPITVIPADEFKWHTHIYKMLGFVLEKATLSAQNPAAAAPSAPAAKKPVVIAPTPPNKNNDDNDELIKEFHNRLKACLSAINAKNSSGVEELRALANEAAFKLKHLNDAYQIALARLGKTGCATFFKGRRAPEIQELYSILKKLDAVTHHDNEKIKSVNSLLKELNIRIQPKKPRATVLSAEPHIRHSL